MLGIVNDTELKYELNYTLGRNVSPNQPILCMKCGKSNTFRAPDYGACHWQHCLSFNEGQLLSALPLRELELMIPKLSIR